MTATNKMTDKILKWMLGIVLALGAISVQGACVCWFHQPEIPDSMKKFAKLDVYYKNTGIEATTGYRWTNADASNVDILPFTVLQVYNKHKTVNNDNDIDVYYLPSDSEKIIYKTNTSYMVVAVVQFEQNYWFKISIPDGKFGYVKCDKNDHKKLIESAIYNKLVHMSRKDFVDGTYYTADGSSCEAHDKCLRYIRLSWYGNSYQCMAFGAMVYEIISGYGAYPDSSTAYVKSDMVLNDAEVTADKLETIPLGSHIRCRVGDEDHSIILAKITEDYVEVYHCNYVIFKENYKIAIQEDEDNSFDMYKCMITYERLSYEEFNNSLEKMLYYNPSIYEPED